MISDRPWYATLIVWGDLTKEAQKRVSEFYESKGIHLNPRHNEPVAIMQEYVPEKGENDD